MADKTGIQWTDATWNPIRGCSVVSAGCKNCYAMRQAHRMNHPGAIEGNGAAPQRHRKPGAYYGLTEVRSGKPMWSGQVRLVPELLDQPLRWKRPRKVFVNSMSDLFHEDVPDQFIWAVISVMAACPQHTFQILTKRAERMLSVLSELPNLIQCAWAADEFMRASAPITRRLYESSFLNGAPLRNAWWGVSCENQAAADERIPLLLQCPATVRWVSAEPLLGPLDLREGTPAFDGRATWAKLLDWVVVGGESGPGARPCAMNWFESIVEQCQDAGTPVYGKQLGAYVVDEYRRDLEGNWAWRAGLKDRNGGDPSEWPEDLCVRQWPEVPA